MRAQTRIPACSASANLGQLARCGGPDAGNYLHEEFSEPPFLAESTLEVVEEDREATARGARIGQGIAAGTSIKDSHKRCPRSSKLPTVAFGHFTVCKARLSKQLAANERVFVENMR